MDIESIAWGTWTVTIYSYLSMGATEIGIFQGSWHRCSANTRMTALWLGFPAQQYAMRLLLAVACDWSWWFSLLPGSSFYK